MKYEKALNEIYTLDKYRHSKPLDPFYYPDGVDVHVKDTVADYRVNFNTTKQGFIVHIVGKGTRNIPKGVNLTKKDIPYEQNIFDIMDRDFSPKQFFDFCQYKPYSHFADFINNEAASKKCNYSDTNDRPLNVLGRSMFFLKQKGIDYIDFQVTDNEVDGVDVKVKVDGEERLHYPEFKSLEFIDDKMNGAKKRKMYDLSNIPWNVKRKLQKS